MVEAIALKENKKNDTPYAVSKIPHLPLTIGIDIEKRSNDIIIGKGTIWGNHFFSLRYNPKQKKGKL